MSPLLTDAFGERLTSQLSALCLAFALFRRPPPTRHLARGIGKASAGPQPLHSTVLCECCVTCPASCAASSPNKWAATSRACAGRHRALKSSQVSGVLIKKNKAKQTGRRNLWTNAHLSYKRAMQCVPHMQGGGGGRVCGVSEVAPLL